MSSERFSETQRRFLGSSKSFETYQLIERTFDYNKIGENYSGIHLDEVENKNNVKVHSEEGEKLEEPPNILYVHPSEIFLPYGTECVGTYRGEVGLSDRKVENSAVVRVEEPPTKRKNGLSEARNILIGEEDDLKLEDTDVILSTYPMA